jgi:hypothetical protein
MGLFSVGTKTGIRVRSPKFTWRAIRMIMRKDPYVTNWLRISLFAFRERLVSIFPPIQPTARH